MERTCLKKIIEWNNKRKKPLVVYGARQVGKTFLIKDIFAERYYKGNYIYIDFTKDEDVRIFVNGDGKNNPPITDAKKIIDFLSLRENKTIDKNTLLIFDEIQEALPIITSLKYFKQDFNDIPVIATGSLVRIKLKRQKKIDNQHNQEGFFFPVGAISELKMHPLSFDEFLLNHNKKLYEAIVKAYKNKEPLDSHIHEMALDVLYKYFLVGGMPENVQMFLDNEPIVKIRENIVSIFDDYLNDMDLYQVSSESIVRAKMIFKSIYQQLNKESKNFKASLLEKKLKTRDLNSPIDWLITANAVYKSNQVKETVSIPFSSNEESNFRLYLMDLGFLAYQSDINMATFIDSNVRNTLSGVFFENYIAEELEAKNIPLYFWKGKNDAEFEFLVNDNNNVIPLDVKKSKGQLNSIDKFKDHNKYYYSVKFSANNYGYDDKNHILTIPLYMVFAYLDELNERNNLIL